MKTTVFIVTILILVFSCNPQTKKPVDNTIYYFLEYDWTSPTIGLVIDTIDVYIDYIQNTYNLKFINSCDDTITYRINELDTSRPEYLINNVKSERDVILFEKRKEYCISYVSRNHIKKRECFIVYKYILNPHRTDGSVLVFWTPRIGIILKRQSSWRFFEKLQTNNDSINNYINTLTDLIYNDNEFYRKSSFLDAEVRFQNEPAEYNKNLNKD